MVECERIGLKWRKYYMKIEQNSPFWRQLDTLLDDGTICTFLDGYDAIANSFQLVGLHSG